MHEHIELPDRYVEYIKDHIELALENFYKDWKRAQKEYDALPWYKRLFRENPEYGDTTGFGQIALDHGHWLNKVDTTEDIVFLKYWANYFGEDSL